MAADLIAGLYGHTNYDVVPSVIYTAPEIAWVGQTEAQARAAGINVKLGNFPFAASARAKAMEAASGFAKIVADADTDRILGVHIIGPMAGELLAEAVLALEYHAAARICSARCTRIPRFPKHCTRLHWRQTSGRSIPSTARESCAPRHSRCRLHGTHR